MFPHLRVTIGEFTINRDIYFYDTIVRLLILIEK